MDRFVECWEGVEDPRSGNAARLDFYELLVIALCTVLCGGQGPTHMAEFATAKEPFLRGFLKLEHGIPSHDTFSRLFRFLDPARFRAAFQRFMAKFSEAYQGVIAIDGKVVRRSFDRASSLPLRRRGAGGKSPSHMAWLTARTTSPCFATWPSMSCRRTPPRDPCAASSCALPGISATSPGCSQFSEVRLPWGRT